MRGGDMAFQSLHHNVAEVLVEQAVRKTHFHLGQLPITIYRPMPVTVKIKNHPKYRGRYRGMATTLADGIPNALPQEDKEGQHGVECSGKRAGGRPQINPSATA